MPKPASNAVLQSTAGTSFGNLPTFLICALGNRLSLAAERTLRRGLNLSLMEWRVLTVLAVEPAAAPGRIIHLVGVNKAAVSRAVNSLKRRGLLRRVGDVDHGLRTHLYLTRKGMTMYRRGEIQRRAAQSILLQDISATNRNQLLRMLQRLMRNADRLIEL